MCCQCGIFDLKEGATFEEVANRIEIYKKCGKEVVSTPVQGLRFNNFLLYVANDSYFGRTVQSLQAKHSVNANDKKLKELGLYKPVAKWQWEDKKLIMERLKPYFEEVLAPKTDEDRERREFFAQMMERARKRWKEEERALKEAEEAKVPPAILAQRKADCEHALRAFEEAKEKFDCEFNVKKKQAKNKKAKSKEAADKAASEEASAETTKTEEPAKEMSNTNLIVVQKSEEPSVPTIHTSHAIKASCKLVFNALCHDTSRFFKGVGECFSVHSWLAKRGYRLVRIDSEESSPSNAQKKPQVKQITCDAKKAGANEENSSVIISPANEAPVSEVQTPTVQGTQTDTAAVDTAADKPSEESKTGASENTTPVPAEQVDQATTEESSKISREVANPELQKQLVQRLNDSVEKSSIHPEKLADMEMDAEIKRLASLKNKDKSDSLSDKKTPQEAKANSKENATANVVQQTRPSSSSNAQSKTETSSATDAETPKAKRGRKKKSDAQTANAPENSAAAPNVKQAGKQKVSSEAKPAPAAKPKANTAASTQPKSNAAPSDQNPPKAKRGRKPKVLQSANSQVSNDTAKSKEVSVVQAAKVNKAAKTAKSAAQPKDSVKPAEKTAKAATQAKAESKPVLKAPAKTPSSGKSSAKAIQAALTA